MREKENGGRNIQNDVASYIEMNSEKKFTATKIQATN